MSIEAMKQALEALELMYACYAHQDWISHKQQEEKILSQCVATSMTLRQAIAEAEKQYPFGMYGAEDLDKAWKSGYDNCKAQRQWVELTRDEILEARWHNKSSYRFARVLETLLKEKNT